MKKYKNFLVYWKESVGRTIKIEPTVYECKECDNHYTMQNNLHALGFKCDLYGIDFEFDLDELKKEEK